MMLQEDGKAALSDYFDNLETRDPAEREAALFARLKDVLKQAAKAPTYAERFKGIDLDSIRNREALATLPVLRKAELPALQKAALPFGGLVSEAPGWFGRLFTSPGPIFEPEATTSDPWRSARGLF